MIGKQSAFSLSNFETNMLKKPEVPAESNERIKIDLSKITDRVLENRESLKNV